jgi:hypothetical protein
MDPFLAAALRGNILGDVPTVQQLYEEGVASVREADRDGMIALALVAHVGRDTILESTNADKFVLGEESYDRLRRISLRSNQHLVESGATRMTFLVKIIALLDAPESLTIQYFRHKELISKGRLLRARLPVHLEQRHVLLVTHCPLPTVLQEVVAAYADLTYADVWKCGLL